jgi:hypothetical protein
MTRFRLALAAALAATAFGCHPSTLGPHSADFSAANAKYVQLLGTDGPVDVFTDPGLAEVQALLAKVPADSVDIEAAKALQKTLESGIAEAEKAAEARKKAESAEAKPLDVVIPTGPGIEPPPSAPAAATPVATPKDGPTVGMSLADFRAKYGACFTRDSAFTDDKGHQGDVYILATPCSGKYPSLTEQMVLVAGDKVLSVLPKSAVQDRQQLSLNQAQVKAAAPVQQVAQAQPVAAEPPPPPNPNTVDQKVAAPADTLQAAPNLNSDLDAREKLPGQP